jgi:hypothetical protein
MFTIFQLFISHLEFLSRIFTGFGQCHLGVYVTHIVHVCLQIIQNTKVVDIVDQSY